MQKVAFAMARIVPWSGKRPVFEVSIECRRIRYSFEKFSNPYAESPSLTSSKKEYGVPLVRITSFASRRQSSRSALSYNFCSVYFIRSPSLRDKLSRGKAWIDRRSVFLGAVHGHENFFPFSSFKGYFSGAQLFLGSEFLPNRPKNLLFENFLNYYNPRPFLCQEDFSTFCKVFWNFESSRKKRKRKGHLP